MFRLFLTKNCAPSPRYSPNSPAPLHQGNAAIAYYGEAVANRLQHFVRFGSGFELQAFDTRGRFWQFTRFNMFKYVCELSMI